MHSDSLQSYFNQITSIPILRLEEEQNASEYKLIESNLKLVVTIAKKYQNRGIEMEDLVSSGNFGLIKAAKAFESNKGNFSSYASKFIQGAICNHFEKYHRTVRLGQKINQDLRILSRVENEFWELSDSELALKTGFKEKKVKRLKFIRQPNVPLEDNLIAEGENPDQICSKRDYFNHLRYSVSKLQKKDRFVIEKYFGLKGESKDLTQIGRELGVSRQYISLVYYRALKNLKKSVDKF